jgi:hypothetical protein
MLSFEPRRPRDTAGRDLESLSVFVRDHRHRDVPVEERSLEAHFGTFSVSQSHKGEREARRWVVETSYGREPREVRVAGHEGRTYDLGPEPPSDDIDGRAPAVVVWHDGGMHFLVASAEPGVDTLLAIAESMYA